MISAFIVVDISYIDISGKKVGIIARFQAVQNFAARNYIGAKKYDHTNFTIAPMVTSC